MSEKLYNVGKIVNVHGIRGGLKVWPHTDFPEERFRKGSRLVLFDPATKTRIPVHVASGRPHKNMYIVQLQEYDDINQVERFKGWELKITQDDLLPLPEGEYYFHQIIGCKAVTEEGDELGVISDILRPGANDVWVVDRPKGKQVLLPVIDDVIRDVDVERRIVTVRLMEGLLE